MFFCGYYYESHNFRHMKGHLKGWFLFIFGVGTEPGPVVSGLSLSGVSINEQRNGVERGNSATVHKRVKEGGDKVDIWR